MISSIKWIFLLVIVLFFSCARTQGGGELQTYENDLLPQIAIDNSIIEATLSEINRDILNNPRHQNGRFVASIENNIAEEIALYLADGNRVHQFSPRDFGWRDAFVTSIEQIIPAQGYYIQQQRRRFQGRGRAPEILLLSVDEGNVFIREIDILNGQIITRNAILLQFNGTTFQYGRTRLEIHNGEIQIIYLENEAALRQSGRIEHEAPYTFAGDLFAPMPDEVFIMTSDYLREFAGRYVVESFKIIRSEGVSIDENLMRNRILQIVYNEESKTLSVLENDLRNPRFPIPRGAEQYFSFVETESHEPFFWTFGEGGLGFVEYIFYFYRGGIALIYESERAFLIDAITREVERVERVQYVVFFNRETATSAVGGTAVQEHTIFYTGQDLFVGRDFSGQISVRTEADGRVVIVPRFSEFSPRLTICNGLSPLIPERFHIFTGTRDIIIRGNTTTITNFNGSWEQIVVDGNITTRTWGGDFSNQPWSARRNNNPGWERTAIDGNTALITGSDDSWIRIIVDGNTTTKTFSENHHLFHSSGGSERIVTDGNIESVFLSGPEALAQRIRIGNTETIIIYGREQRRKVINDNNITITQYDFLSSRYLTTLELEREGNNIFVQYIHIFAGNNSLDTGEVWWGLIYM